MDKTVAKTAVILTTFFILSALLCGSICSMIVSPVFFVPVIHSRISGNFLLEIFQISRDSFLSAGLVFLSGFSVFPRRICASVMIWRGLALGLALSFEHNGSVMFLRNRKVLFVPSSVCLVLLFALSALLMVFMSAVSVAFSDNNTDKSGGAARALEIVKYILKFLVFTGALITLDVLRYYLI